MTKSLAKPRFFKKPDELRAWLEKNHAEQSELWIGLYRAKAAHQGVVYQQALDEALAFGWIDGVRQSIDDDTWMIRFTPRKQGSSWSVVNVKRAKELDAEGKLAPAGKKAFEERDLKKAEKSYSYENERTFFSDDEEMGFRQSQKAWQFWLAQPPSYVKIARFWVTSAKRPETRSKRVKELIASSEKGERLKQFTYVKKP